MSLDIGVLMLLFGNLGAGLGTVLSKSTGLFMSSFVNVSSIESVFAVSSSSSSVSVNKSGDLSLAGPFELELDTKTAELLATLSFDTI